MDRFLQTLLKLGADANLEDMSGKMALDDYCHLGLHYITVSRYKLLK